MNTMRARCSQECMKHVDHFTHRFFNASIELADATENFARCPVGLLLMLSMLLGSSGCNGNTAKQIEQTMDFDSLNQERRIHSTSNLYHRLSKSLTSEVTHIGNYRKPVLQIWNRIVVTESILLSEKFKNRVKNVFHTDVENLISTRNARELIKIRSVEDSRGIITQCFEIRSKVIDGSLLWMNMIAFEDTWAERSTAVGELSFFLSDSEKIIVPMMNLKGYIRYVSRGELGLSLVRISMKNSRYSFIVFLPNPNINMIEVEGLLRTEHSFKDYFDENGFKQYVDLRLPKFKLSATNDHTSVASNMSIFHLFDHTRANLIESEPSSKLYVSRILQGVNLNVDENGIGAVAPASHRTATRFNHPSHTFYVDRPFVCLIYDSLLNIPIVSARVVNPTV